MNTSFNCIFIECVKQLRGAAYRKSTTKNFCLASNSTTISPHSSYCFSSFRLACKSRNSKIQHTVQATSILGFWTKTICERFCGTVCQQLSTTVIYRPVHEFLNVVCWCFETEWSSDINESSEAELLTNVVPMSTRFKIGLSSTHVYSPLVWCLLE